jgi:hypothetical protein
MLPSAVGLPSGSRVWLAAGVTDMRAGFNAHCRKGGLPGGALQALPRVASRAQLQAAQCSLGLAGSSGVPVEAATSTSSVPARIAHI